MSSDPGRPYFSGPQLISILGSNSPREAAVAVLKRVNSRSPHVSMLALSVSRHSPAQTVP